MTAVLAMILLLWSAPAGAVVPLLPAADVADVGLKAWWRAGELVVGMPDQPGQPGLRPLVSLEPTALPADLSAWAAVGEHCVTDPESRGLVGGSPYKARVVGSGEGPVVQLLRQDEVVAANALGRPARVCEVLLAEADALPGLELVVAWRMELGTEGQELLGITVYRIPESLD